MYVGQTSRHLITRLDEHCRRGTPVREHFESCGVSSSEIRRQSSIVDSAKFVGSLLTLEALHIGDMRVWRIEKSGRWKHFTQDHLNVTTAGKKLKREINVYIGTLSMC